MAQLAIRPYQSEGLEFLTSRPRAALFDRPGLGKSMQALLSMRDQVPAGRILVVATGDAIGVWQDEIAKWLEEEATVYAGTKATNAALFHGGFVVTNYHRLATALALNWQGVIFDESQMLRNRNTRTLFQTVRRAFDDRRMGYHGVPAYFLSGTPIVKAAGDIWPILHLIDKKRWGSYWKFVREYCITWEDQFGWHVEGITNLKGLWAETADVILRRTEGEVPLPEKIRQRIPLTMHPRQAKAYHDLMRDMYTDTDDGRGLLLTPSVLARETRLRQILASPRILGIDDDGAAVRALIEIAGRSEDPMVVFSPFAEAIRYAEPALAATGRPTYAIRGGMGSEFHREIEFFKSSSRAGEAPILFSTVQMGKSWDVSREARDVYFLEPDWNETTQVQAESRLHREGQTGTVRSHYFVHSGTHDEEALEILAGKRRLADAILDHAVARRKRVRVA